ncbi:MAG TPA: FAD-dependent monooxygenase [Stackebrandtia sp.]|jgi:2-polyprenyl-6-methoxyphenol hydroxylase-like FAD-dependent oxidoreductase|uniref:FAD-dependent monooxygenase n=1 Tax=Stackebrandtia sp. TaxID=2023065 RepID=UPI002D669D0E|nr:FAD-dependent monooxygenase [Stackebrandtia sp.]HZE39801.1 FAD-dependent monooxygenase [Stackebrandtia sp.]
MPTPPSVLISGASIAGPALAFWLSGAGYRVTLVERHPGPRPGGNGVDIRGEAMALAEEMGIADAIRDHATDIADLVFVNSDGKTSARVRMSAFDEPSDVEIMRGDLAAILHEETRGDCEYVFDDSIAALHPGDRGVDVDFVGGDSRRFDLVVGADGLHSHTRGLAGLTNPAIFRHWGLYFAIAALEGRRFGRERSVVLHNSPARVAGIYSSGNHDIEGAFFLFHADLASFDYRDTQRQRQLLRESFASEGWRVPELVEEAVASDTYYMDSVTQVRMPRWSRGRVVLLGDAAYCATLLSGSGASLALQGAKVLADALIAADADPAAAFARYEQRFRPTVVKRQKQVGVSAAMLMPRTAAGIWVRNRFCQLLGLSATAKLSYRRSLRTR